MTGLTPVTDEVAFLAAQQERDAKNGDRVFSVSLDALVDGGLLDPPASSLRPWDDVARPLGSVRKYFRSPWKRRGWRHGTLSMYSNHKCRCFDCAEAARLSGVKARRAKGVKPRAMPLHGTTGMYRNHGCRCEDCREAVRLEARTRRAAKRGAMTG